jgi:hypothetical protein
VTDRLCGGLLTKCRNMEIVKAARLLKELAWAPYARPFLRAEAAGKPAAHAALSAQKLRAEILSLPGMPALLQPPFAGRRHGRRACRWRWPKR